MRPERRLERARNSVGQWRGGGGGAEGGGTPCRACQKSQLQRELMVAGGDRAGNWDRMLVNLTGGGREMMVAMEASCSGSHVMAALEAASIDGGR
jgi:hypothetical protein